MKFDELMNKVKQFTNEEDSSFLFKLDMFEFDVSLGVFSEILANELIINQAEINYTESFIQIEGTSFINSINLKILIVLFIEDETEKYHCIVTLPDEWIHNNAQDFENYLKQFKDISEINSNIRHPGLALSTGGPFLGSMNEIEGLSPNINISGFNLFSEIEFTGGQIDTLRTLLNFPNTFKLLAPSFALRTPSQSLIKAYYTVPLTKGDVKFDEIVFSIASSYFELSCNMQIDIGRDMLMFQAGVNFVEEGSIGFVFRLIGVQNKDNQLGMTKDWINPLGIHRITISELAARYSVESKGFVISLSGTIKIGKNQNDEIVLIVKALELVNGTLPTAFIGSLHRSNGDEITMSKLINCFFKIIDWEDGTYIDVKYRLLDEIKVKDLELYFVLGPNKFTSPHDNLITFDPGLGMYVDGSLDTFNVKIHVFEKEEDGFLISGQMDVLNFGNGLITITSASNINKGPSFTFQSAQDRDLQIDLKVYIFKLPMITLSASRGKDTKIIFNLKDDNFLTNFQNSSGTSYCRGELINSNEISVQFKGSIWFVKELSIPILNFKKCAIKLAISFNFDATLKATLDNFKTDFTVQISVLNQVLKVTGSTDTAFTTLKQLEEEMIKKVVTTVKDQIKDVSIDDLLKWFDNDMLYFVDEIGQVLKDLDISAIDAAKYLNGIKKFSGKHEEILSILNLGGYSVTDLKQITVFTVPSEWLPGSVDLGGVSLGNTPPRLWHPNI
ncbi:hypothetical protein LAV73_09370 [Lysinibacillus xylanilyticus]|uniref:hypothetical protein n=1 Tax=Lysinibacillus xylanilyticus TaxID=582475 RepID=UPI002B23FD28|nr:hypothetical protein [Lysinibacillus xylanilyticus]MEB2280203.1 hypothetical protein [Lysinibacillus xylanilyticus]